MVLNSIITHPQKSVWALKKLFASHNSDFCTRNIESCDSTSLSFFAVTVSQLLFRNALILKLVFHFLLISNTYLCCRLNSQLPSRLIDVLFPTECWMFRIVNQCVKAQNDILTCVVCSQSEDIQLTDKDTRKYWHLFLQNVLIPMTPAWKQLAIKLIDADYSANQYSVVALRQTRIFSEDEKLTWDCRVNPYQPEAGLCTSTTTSVRNVTVKIKLYLERAGLITTEWSLCIDFTHTEPLYKPLLAHYELLVSVELAMTWHIYQKDLGGADAPSLPLFALLKFGTPGCTPQQAALHSVSHGVREGGQEGGRGWICRTRLTTPRYGKFVSHIDCLYLFSARGSLLPGGGVSSTAACRCAPCPVNSAERTGRWSSIFTRGGYIK